MNLLKIASREKDLVEVDTADLSVEEFAELRRLLDLSGIMEAKDDPSPETGSAADTITITVTTADGVHDHTFAKDTISSELEELMDLIKYLGKVHPQIDFAHPAPQPRVSSMS